MKTRYWILIICGAALLCGILTFALFGRNTPAKTAEVYSDGVLVAALDLSENTEITVRYKDGSNTVTVRDGTVCVSAATCPDGTCMKCGRRNCGAPIICLPNRLTIRFSDTRQLDAVAY